MNKDIQLFSFEDLPVRVFMIDGNPWWVISDVCQILGIVNVGNVIMRLDQDGVRQADVIDSIGRTQKTAIANEPNLYRLIFRSDKPNAKDFQDWVFEKVLPSIRKTGSYSINQATQEQIFTKDVQRRCMLNEKLLPSSFWCVVTEMWREAWTLEAFQKELKPSSLPDGSCGTKWRNHLKRINHPLLSKSKQERLHVPNLPNLVKVWVYPNELLFEFRRWIRVEYAEYYVKNYLPTRDLRKKLA